MQHSNRKVSNGKLNRNLLYNIIQRNEIDTKLLRQFLWRRLFHLTWIYKVSISAIAHDSSMWIYTVHLHKTYNIIRSKVDEKKKTDFFCCCESQTLSRPTKTRSAELWRHNMRRLDRLVLMTYSARKTTGKHQAQNLKKMALSF